MRHPDSVECGSHWRPLTGRDERGSPVFSRSDRRAGTRFRARCSCRSRTRGP
jgi:hypothetical protein